MNYEQRILAKLRCRGMTRAQVRQFACGARTCFTLLRRSSINTLTDLIQIVSDCKDPSLRSAACFIFCLLPDKRALPALTRALKESTGAVCWEAARALGVLNDVRAAKALKFALIRSREQIVRQAAAYGLGGVGVHLKQGHQRTALREILTKVLRNKAENPEVRAQAAESIGLVGDRKAVRDLTATLEDKSGVVRFWSLYALGMLGDPVAIPAMRRLLGDKAKIPGYWSVSEEARRMIQYIEHHPLHKRPRGAKAGERPALGAKGRRRVER